MTFGYNEPSGNSYRRYLQCLLYTGGNPTAFIGSIEHGDWPNNRNDGFNLHTIDQILEAGSLELTLPTEKPNIILVHAGTVNLVFGVNVTTAPERLGNLLDFITGHNPSSLVLVAQVVPNANKTTQSLINTYNAELPAVVASRARAGKKVALVDLTDLDVRADLLSDGTHLNYRGGRKAAEKWYKTLVEADRRGLITPAQSPFLDLGATAVPSSGRCADLVR